MATANLANTSTSYDTSKDSVIIQRNIDSIPGGRTLDVTGYGPALTGNIATLGAITGGSAYVNGTYTDVPLTGGAGTNATADITVAGGAVTAVVIKSGGAGYVVGNSLSAAAANIGGAGTGFAVPVATIQAKDAEVVIKAGHVILKVTATGEYEPMPIVGGAQYGALPAGRTYAGILIATILVAKPFAGIMINGRVNTAAAYFPYTVILAALQTALPRIDFRAD
jgi:hypothetical protein